jgi:hypothetical protein
VLVTGGAARLSRKPRPLELTVGPRSRGTAARGARRPQGYEQPNPLPRRGSGHARA